MFYLECYWFLIGFGLVYCFNFLVYIVYLISNQKVIKNYMLLVVFRFFSLIFKWRRLIYILMSFEFILLGLFVIFGFGVFGTEILFFIRFSVVSRLLGLVVMVMRMKNYGSDLCVF